MRIRLSVVLLSLLLFIGTAGAEEPLSLESLTVTAEKQEQDLQKVPVSVTALTGMEIEDRRIRSISDVADFTPNFISPGSGIVGLSIPSIRGIHQDGSGSSPVGLFVDGVPILSATGFNDALLDIERVEVLRGPQGTLYGGGTEAGAVNVITRQPGNEVTGKACFEAGEDDKMRLTASLSSPIKKDVLAFSLSALHYEKDGYIKNTNTGEMVNNRDYDYGKAILRWTPTSALDISLIASALRHDDGDQGLALGPAGPAFYGVPVPNKREVQSDLQGWNKSESNMQALKVAWDMSENCKIQSVTTRRRYRSNYLNDWDFTSSVSMFAPMHKEMDNILRNVSEELKFSWNGEGASVVTGVYADMDDNDFTDIDAVTDTVTENHNTTGKGLGLFVHGEKALTDKLALVTGVRYDWAEGEFDDTIRSREIDESWSEVSPKLSLKYAVTPEMMVYAGASKGYRKGGFNDHASPTDPETYDEESLISYELGTKSQWLGNRLRLNVSAYYMDISDMQVRIDSPVSPEFNYTDNAAESYSTGAELEATARVTTGLTLSGSFGYNRTVFKDYSDAKGDYEGNKNPYAPDYTYSLNGLYRHPVGVFTNLSYVGTGRMFLDKENVYKRDAYGVVNAKVGYETEHLDIYLYADNLLDEEYNAIGYFGGVYNVYSPPREVGVKVACRF
ncbi:TonB-dependent receptor [Desulfoluna spongiiphila]|uniref:TonB-dependent receptor n=1 Tax=Desulfoluna spongiiphila TaxID=419481 RepID=UPI0012540543|nr:TonB-dependent receptor [Desulfoluna spongiiphila]VVS94542.1 tonb-dependent receptor-like beta-barrel [Desulfoluna spongiiphila]